MVLLLFNVVQGLWREEAGGDGWKGHLPRPYDVAPGVLSILATLCLLGLLLKLSLGNCLIAHHLGFL
jgi:hypothetical protein